MDKAEKAGGNVVDLPPNLLEGYGLQLLLKRVAEYTKKQFHIAADGDMKVILSPNICQHFCQHFCHHFLSPILSPIFSLFLSPFFVTNIKNY